MTKVNFTRVLLCFLVFGFPLVVILAAPAAADDFQRYIIFHNELPITTYPVITAVESENGKACGTSGILRRIIVNSGQEGAGVPTGETVTVSLPKDIPCWYSAVRVYLFGVDLTAFENQINPVDRTVRDPPAVQQAWNPPLCAAGACWSGTAVGQYPLDSPAQLIEYTIDSINPSTGKAFSDPNNPNGIAVVDIDLSYVDSVYLPVAVGLDDGGATRYMGTALTYDQFNKRPPAFLNLKDAGQTPTWSEFAAYSAANRPNNVFHDSALGFTKDQPTAHIEGGFNLVHNVRVGGVTPLYKTVIPPFTYKGKRICEQVPMCFEVGLTGPENCCPTDDNTFLTCCGVPTEPPPAYIIDNTTITADLISEVLRNGILPHFLLNFNQLPIGRTVAMSTFSNPSVTSLVKRFTYWIETDPCANLANTRDFPNPAFNDTQKRQFCEAFRQTVQYVWNTFYNSTGLTDVEGNPIPDTDCFNATPGAARNLCAVDNILGYTAPKEVLDTGRLNQSVQALMRNVPWVDPTTDCVAPKNPCYSFDKFILFWAPYDSVFNLNPYTRFVHNNTEGVDAPGAYSFSIDDRFGNFQSRASGFIIDVGGQAALLNKEPYDFWEQYRVNFAKGWDHATVCGRKTAIPGQLPANAPIAFWQDGIRMSFCDLVFYKTKDETQYAKYRVGATSRTVTDTYTGLAETVAELTYDQNYCEQNSKLVNLANLANFCGQLTKIAATFKGTSDDPGEAYVSLPDAQKPKVNLIVPAPP